jgi:RNA polymerase sigma factor (TIGR02999 family)
MSDSSSSPNVTNLLVAWGQGDQQAFDRLTPEVQKELHRIAAHYMAAERPGHDLQATALINEAYLRLVDWKDIQWADRAHFFGMAANMMRRVLVDHARQRDRVKRGGEAIQVSLSEAAHVPTPERADLLALDEALQRLEKLDPRKSRIVEMRFFGGLSLEETAEALNVSVTTVRRDWTLARVWLFRELKQRSEGASAIR